MSVTDAPDWQRIVTTVQAAGDVPDAPDWQRIVVGPGATPVGGGSGGGLLSTYYNAEFLGVTIDPTGTTTSAVPRASSVTFMMFAPFKTATANYIWPNIYTGGTPTANECFMAIYDTGQATAGYATLLGATATGACDVPFSQTGPHKIALATPVALTAGQNYYAAMLNNYSAAVGNIYANAINGNAANPLGLTLPFAANSPATYTSLPSSLAFSAMGLIATYFEFFVS